MADLIAARRFFFDVHPFGKTDPLSVMNRMFAGWFCADRFGILNKYSCYRVAEFNEKFPKAKNLSLSDICDNRAVELMNQNKPIVVLWSGGVDSTAIVSSFLKNNIPLDQLTVAYSAMTEEEYPLFLETMRKQGVNLQRKDNIPAYCNELSDCLIINGWCADQLFGSDVHRFNIELYNKPWKEGIREMLITRGIHLNEKSLEALENVYSDYAQKLGLEISEFCEFAWMYNFSIKWTFVREAAKLICVNKVTRDCVVNFFETDDFQSWSVSNFDNIKKHNVFKEPKFYKQPLKQYVFDFNGDEDYFLNKPKVNSRSSTEPEYRRIFVLDTDGYHTYQFKNTSDPQNSFRELRRSVARNYLRDESR